MERAPCTEGRAQRLGCRRAALATPFSGQAHSWSTSTSITLWALLPTTPIIWVVGEYPQCLEHSKRPVYQSQSSRPPICSLFLFVLIPTNIHVYPRCDWFFLFLFLFLFFLFLFLFFVFFWDRVSLYSSGCPGPHFVDQAGLELRNHLPLPPKCWD